MAIFKEENILAKILESLSKSFTPHWTIIVDFIGFVFGQNSLVLKKRSPKRPL